MSLSLLVDGSAECGPSANNPLRSLAKTFDKDRGAQQVRTTSPHSIPRCRRPYHFVQDLSSLNRAGPSGQVRCPWHCVSEPTDHKSPRFQIFRTHTNPVSTENLKEATNFFSPSDSPALLQTPLSLFEFSSLKNALPVVNHQSLQVPMSFPEMLQETTKSDSSGAAWASDFMNFQPTSSSKQTIATRPSVRTQNVQQQPLQNPGL